MTAQPAQDRPGPARRGQKAGGRDARRPGAAQRVRRRRVVPVEELTAEYARDLGSAGVLLTSAVACQDVLDVLVYGMAQQRAADPSVLAARPELTELVDVLRRHIAEAEADDYRRAQLAAVSRWADLGPRAGAENDEGEPWNPHPAEVMTVAEAAQRLGIGERRVRKLAESGQLLGRRVGWSWQLDRSAVIRAAEDRKERNP